MNRRLIDLKNKKLDYVSFLIYEEKYRTIRFISAIEAVWQQEGGNIFSSAAVDHSWARFLKTINKKDREFFFFLFSLRFLTNKNYSFGNYKQKRILTQSIQLGLKIYTLKKYIYIEIAE